MNDDEDDGKKSRYNGQPANNAQRKHDRSVPLSPGVIKEMHEINCEISEGAAASRVFACSSHDSH